MYPSILNSFPVIRTASAKNRSFTYRSPHFCFPWRRPYDYHAICCMDGKTVQCLSNPSQHVPICFQQFLSYSNRKCKKIAVFTYRSPHFCLPWRRPCDYHAICCIDGKTIQCLQMPRSTYPSTCNSFPVIRTASAKNSRFRVLQPTFLFPLETPL